MWRSMDGSASSDGAAMQRGEMQSAQPAEEAIPLIGDVHWISECYPLGERHEHVSLYLIRHGDKNIVMDSGSFYHRESIERKLRKATANAGVHALIVSHSDYEHAGNISAFQREWGEFDIYASCGDPKVQGLPYAKQCKIGGTREIFGRVFSFIDPPLADRSHTSWAFDHQSRVLFAADGFGHYHRPGECTWISSQFDGGIRSDDIHDFHRDNIGWLRYVDPDRFRRRLDTMFAELDVSFVAPIHGNPILHADLDSYIDRLVAGATRVANEYVPSV
jgi:flavorubredoxin